MISAQYREVIARRAAPKQSRGTIGRAGLLRFAHNDAARSRALPYAILQPVAGSARSLTATPTYLFSMPSTRRL